MSSATASVGSAAGEAWQRKAEGPEKQRRGGASACSLVGRVGAHTRSHPFLVFAAVAFSGLFFRKNSIFPVDAVRTSAAAGTAARNGAEAAPTTALSATTAPQGTTRRRSRSRRIRRMPVHLISNERDQSQSSQDVDVEHLFEPEWEAETDAAVRDDATQSEERDMFASIFGAIATEDENEDEMDVEDDNDREARGAAPEDEEIAVPQAEPAEVTASQESVLSACSSSSWSVPSSSVLVQGDHDEQKQERERCLICFSEVPVSRMLRDFCGNSSRSSHAVCRLCMRGECGSGLDGFRSKLQASTDGQPPSSSGASRPESFPDSDELVVLADAAPEGFRYSGAALQVIERVLRLPLVPGSEKSRSRGSASRDRKITKTFGEELRDAILRPKGNYADTRAVVRCPICKSEAFRDVDADMDKLIKPAGGEVAGPQCSASSTFCNRGTEKEKIDIVARSRTEFFADMESCLRTRRFLARGVVVGGVDSVEDLQDSYDEIVAARVKKESSWKADTLEDLRAFARRELVDADWRKILAVRFFASLPDHEKDQFSSDRKKAKGAATERRLSWVRMGKGTVLQLCTGALRDSFRATTKREFREDYVRTRRVLLLVAKQKLLPEIEVQMSALRKHISNIDDLLHAALDHSRPAGAGSPPRKKFKRRDGGEEGESSTASTRLPNADWDRACGSLPASTPGSTTPGGSPMAQSSRGRSPGPGVDNLFLRSLERDLENANTRNLQVVQQHRRQNSNPARMVSKAAQALSVVIAEQLAVIVEYFAHATAEKEEDRFGLLEKILDLTVSASVEFEGFAKSFREISSSLSNASSRAPAAASCAAGIQSAVRELLRGAHNGVKQLREIVVDFYHENRGQIFTSGGRGADPSFGGPYYSAHVIGGLAKLLRLNVDNEASRLLVGISDKMQAVLVDWLEVVDCSHCGSWTSPPPPQKLEDEVRQLLVDLEERMDCVNATEHHPAQRVLGGE